MAKRKNMAEEEIHKDQREESLGAGDNSKAKKAKKPTAGPSDTNPSTHDNEEVKVHSTSEGEKFVSLGKKKRATVRTFKGAVMVDIREFYGEDGNEKPGKKGISLNLEQWRVLRRSIDTIDSLLAAENEK